ncbi:MAG: helicase-related protein [Proteobacteria bacterium]|nr:helicase-related protein [Pseudomonadota bacterium]
MSRITPDRARVIALLGPTNTGKTHLAVERMLGHRSGMIGFPLRLLAREIYDRVVARRGAGAAALVTGEEKRIPANPKYYLCTVESMPLDKRADFLAIDEIQLAGERERGHIFTDRLLHARGRQETMLLGSTTMRPLIRRLVPEAEFISRPRFSKLTYAGPKKLARLPPRSAIVAFSVEEVYAIAEQIRRQRGGAAVVLGALSPSTRNAQVAMYEAGEVDYLVATDAIGMGLNMDVNHIAFASLTKFDGWHTRRLTVQEIAQIAGRAGRHMNDGTFGTRAELGPLEPDVVEAVEKHRFEPLTSIFWRNRHLDFASLPRLLRDLEAPPPASGLMRAPEAEDTAVLALLARDALTIERASTPERIRRLWEVCQVPDYRKVMPEHHASLVRRLFLHLTEGDERLPVDWVARQIDGLERTDGDIDALTARIAHIRTWTYVSHRADWLSDASYWQERSRSIEDKLSEALHERLTQRFVDRRATRLTRRMASSGELLGGITKAGEVIVEGQAVGRLAGFRLMFDETESKMVRAAARRVLADEMPRRVARLCADPDEAFGLADNATLLWNGQPIARLAAGETALAPRLEPIDAELLDGPQRERIRRRLSLWLAGHLEAGLGPLIRLSAAPLAGAARGLAFQLVESLGSLGRDQARSASAALTPEDRRRLARLGVRHGRYHLYLAGLLKAAPVRLRALLWSAREGRPPPPLPPPGRVSLAIDPQLPAAYYRAIGYAPLGPRALRVDMVERLAAEGRRLGRRGPFGLEPALLSLAACSPETLAMMLATLGFRPIEASQNNRLSFLPPARDRPKGRGARAGKRAPPDPDSPFAELHRLAHPEKSTRS